MEIKKNKMINMKKTEIFLHIGLHKTGTTFFQNNIYNNIDDINLIKNNVHLRDIVIEKLTKIYENAIR